MTQAVTDAVEEIIAGFSAATVTTKDDGEGGAYVLVDPVSIGPHFDPTTSWIGFHITFPYPEADIYPHFIDSGVKYVGDKATNEHPEGNLPVAMSRGHKLPSFDDRDAIQISRRTKNVNPDVDTALYKLHRIVSFLKAK